MVGELQRDGGRVKDAACFEEAVEDGLEGLAGLFLLAQPEIGLRPDPGHPDVILGACQRWPEAPELLLNLFDLVPLAKLGISESETVEGREESVGLRVGASQPGGLPQELKSGGRVELLEAGRRVWESLSPHEQALARGVALIDRLLERAVALRFADPAEMVSLAEAACALSETLPRERYGAKVVNDIQARAWAELGNALRVADDLSSAGQALARARELASEGTRSFPLVGRLTSLVASLLTDLRRFDEALLLLEPLEDAYRERRQMGALAKLLVKIGHIRTQAHEPEHAIAVYQRALLLLDPGHRLRLPVVHSLALNWVEIGEYEPARRLIDRNRRLYRRSGKLNEFRLLWLEGKIALGLGDFRKAEGKLQTARLAYLRVEKPGDAALVSLDLALLLARQERRKELRSLIEQMLRTFRTLGIARETVAALLLLQKSCEEMRSKDILCGQIEALARLLPELRPRSSGTRRPE